MKATAVSIRADRNFLKALKVIAARQGKPVADLVHDALVSLHGDEIREQVSFFASIGNKNVQLEQNKSIIEVA